MPVRPTHLIILSSLTLGAVLFTPSVSQASSTTTASTVFAAAVKAMFGEKSVHKVTVVTSKSGATVMKDTYDMGMSSGQWTHWEADTAHRIAWEIRVTAKDEYISGNAKGLTMVLPLTSVQQKKVGSKIIVIKPGTSRYGSAWAFLTMSGLMILGPPQTGVSLTTNSHHDYVLIWTNVVGGTKMKFVLTISSRKKALPMSEVMSGGGGSRTTVFSRWGKSFTVTTPPASELVDYTSIVTG